MSTFPPLRLLIPTTPDFHKNLQKCGGGNNPCAICGRDIDTNKVGVKYVYTVDGGDLCSKEEMEYGAGWEMAVGPDCWKKHPEIHEYQTEA